MFLRDFKKLIKVYINGHAAGVKASVHGVRENVL